MQHEPAPEIGEDAAAAYKTRVGVILFLIYGLVYAGFAAINTLSPKLMGNVVFAGLNLATVYGFGLILLAIVMGLIYNSMCTRAENRLNLPEGKQAHDL